MVQDALNARKIRLEGCADTARLAALELSWWSRAQAAAIGHPAGASTYFFCRGRQAGKTGDVVRLGEALVFRATTRRAVVTMRVIYLQYGRAVPCTAAGPVRTMESTADHARLLRGASAATPT